MDNAVAEEMLNQLENLDCPFVCDVDASYLSQLLLVPSQHRMRILSWLFSRIDNEIKNEIESFHNNPSCFVSSLEVDREVQLLTDIGTSLGLCSSTDFALIRGKASSTRHLALWKNLLTIATATSKDDKEHTLRQDESAANQVMEAILRSGYVASSLSSKFHVLLPAIKKELEISMKTTKVSNSSASMTIDTLSEELETFQRHLNQQRVILESLKKANPDLSATPDEPSLLGKLHRSLNITLGDLVHLQTSFVQIFDNHFQTYCDKESSKFSNLGQTVHNVNNRLSTFLQLFKDLDTIREAYRSLVGKKLDVLFTNSTDCH